AGVAPAVRGLCHRGRGPGGARGHTRPARNAERLGPGADGGRAGRGARTRAPPSRQRHGGRGAGGRGTGRAPHGVPGQIQRLTRVIPIKTIGGPMPRGDQLSRQWRLLQMIDRPQGVTVDDAARDLRFTIRTIWRDLGVLQTAGFPIYTERAADGNRGVWRVTEEFKRALPLMLNLGELVELLVSLDLLSPLGVSVLGPAVVHAFARVQG